MLVQSQETERDSIQMKVRLTEPHMQEIKKILSSNEKKARRIIKHLRKKMQLKKVKIEKEDKKHQIMNRRNEINRMNSMSVRNEKSRTLTSCAQRRLR